MKRIAIISGNIRPNSNTQKVSKWVLSKAKSEDNQYELVDLMDYNLPHFNEPKSPRSATKYVYPETIKWSETIKQYDGFIFVIPEYNGYFPGVVKDAVDFLYHEWLNKPFGLVGIGGKGGQWACNHLQTLLERFDMSFKGFVGITNPWSNIDIHGNINEEHIINSIENIFNEF